MELIIKSMVGVAIVTFSSEKILTHFNMKDLAKVIKTTGDSILILDFISLIGKSVSILKHTI